MSLEERLFCKLRDIFIMTDFLNIWMLMSTVDDIYKSYTKYPEIFFREPFLELILKKYIK